MCILIHKFNLFIFIIFELIFKKNMISAQEFLIHRLSRTKFYNYV